MPKDPDTTTESKTGIKVVIVGAGFGGLAAAIECHLQGHDVVVLEAVQELKPFGDIVSFGSNGGRIFGHWSKGYMLKKFLGVLHYYPYFDVRKYDGTKVVRQPPPEKIPDAPTINGHRGEMHMITYYYARDVLKIDIRTNSPVQGYFEDENSAGVVLANGEKVIGDVVIGSDGVRSKARELVLGYFEKPHSSGYAVFRAWWPGGEDLLDDPLTKEFADYGDTFTGWAGPHVHFLVLVSKGGKEVSWFLTHKDDADIDESWSYPGRIEDALEVVKGYDPKCTAVITKTPKGALTDYKLVYRDPLPTWISKHGRTALLGDSAHPFLPTSMQGASQAMEDGVTIALCLRKAGKDNIPLALHTYERLRWDHVRRAQKTGETTRDRWHKADWDAVKEDPSLVQLPHPPFLLRFDCRKFADEQFDVTAEEIKQGRVLKDFDDPEYFKMKETIKANYTF